jgi:cytidylate kinase
VGRGGLMFMLVIWLQGIWLPLHGYSFVSTPLWAGIYMLPLTAGFLIAGPISGWLSDRYGARPFATGGMIAAAASFGLLTLLPADFSYQWFALLLLMNGLAMGLFAAPNTAGIMNSVPANERGVASGMRSTFQNTGMTLSIGLFFTIMIVGLASSLPAALSHGLTAQGVSASDAATVAHLSPVSVLFAAFLGYNPVSTLLGPTLTTLSPAHQAALRSPTFFAHLISGPFLHGLSIVFTFAMVICLIAAAASWLRGAKAVPEMAAAGADRIGLRETLPLLPAGDAVSARVRAAVGPTEATGTLGRHGARIVTISASFGAGGSHVGPALAKRLGLPFFDRAIPRQVAERLGISLTAAMAHDEHAPGEMVRALVTAIGTPVSFGVAGVQSPPTPDEEGFRRANENVLWELASGAGGVVLGRAGAVVLASCPDALHVRLDGPAESRAARAAGEQGIDPEVAWEQLRQTDQGRTNYVRRWYGRDPDDPDLYHLTIDSTGMPLDACVDAIAAVATDLWADGDSTSRG